MDRESQQVDVDDDNDYGIDFGNQMTTEQATRTGHALSSIKTAIKKEHKSHGRLPISRDPAKNALATMQRKANEHAQNQ